MKLSNVNSSRNDVVKYTTQNKSIHRRQTSWKVIRCVQIANSQNIAVDCGTQEIPKGHAVFLQSPSPSNTAQLRTGVQRVCSKSTEPEITSAVRFSGYGMDEVLQSTPNPDAPAHRTWEMKGPVSTPSAEDRKSCDCGSARPSGPTATPFISAKPGIVAKLSVGRPKPRSSIGGKP